MKINISRVVNLTFPHGLKETWTKKWHYIQWLIKEIAPIEG